MKRQLLNWLSGQLARPHGVWTAPMSALLNRGNRLINAHTLGALDLAPEQRVLEVGFGGGVGLRMATEHESSLQLHGVDISDDVVNHLQRQMPTMSLVRGDVTALPFEDDFFDAAYAVNVAYFWPDVPAALTELRRVLAPGGKLALGLRPAAACRQLAFERNGYRAAEPAWYAEGLSEAGFDVDEPRRYPDPGGGTYVVLGRA